MSDLDDIAKSLHHAAAVGGHEAGTAAVHAGAMQAEVGMRLPGRFVSVAATTGDLSARIGATQRRGVFQEHAPATAPNVSTEAIAHSMQQVAAAVGASAVEH